jgi:hypothetical protein
VTGIFTTAILYLGNRFWHSRVRPFLEGTRYTGVDISGAWEGDGSGEDHTGKWSNKLNLHLTQSAANLTGTFNLNVDATINPFELDFKVSGRIWEGYVVLNFTPSDRRITSFATALLKIGGGVVALVGIFAFRNVHLEQVTSENVSLTRKSPLTKPQ